MSYAGKYPHRIKSASIGKSGVWVLQLNNGRVHKIPASQISGLMPRPGEEISKYIDAGLPMVKLSVNPVKKTRKNPVEQDIGKSKYPHYVFDYSIQFDAGAGGWATVAVYIVSMKNSGEKWNPEAGFSDLTQAKMLARYLAKQFPLNTIKVEKKS